MEQYRFILERYHYGSKMQCPSCGRKACFVRFVDTWGEIIFPEYVGRCDHEVSCGYLYTPKDYFIASGGMMPRYEPSRDRKMPVSSHETSYMDVSILKRTTGCYESNPLFRFLSSRFGEEETERLFLMYNVGTSRKWGGAAIFWQMDTEGRVRSGKIMAYDEKTGHRIKDDGAGRITWAHSLLENRDFCYRRCLFGEHLLALRKTGRVMLVESEKSAVIASHFMPEFIWLATSGIAGAFKESVMEALRGRDVCLVPDLGGMEKWKRNMDMMRGICHSVSMMTFLEYLASDEDKRQGLDIADFLLRSMDS